MMTQRRGGHFGSSIIHSDLEVVGWAVSFSGTLASVFRTAKAAPNAALCEFMCLWASPSTRDNGEPLPPSLLRPGGCFLRGQITH